MSNKDYKEGFKDGFKEGWEAAIKQTKRFDYPVMPSVPTIESLMACPVCRRSGPRNEICSHPQCPTRVTAVGAIGAAGSDTFNNYPLGANGPSESLIKPKEPSFNHQLDYSEYENNTYRRD